MKGDVRWAIGVNTDDGVLVIEPVEFVAPIFGVNGEVGHVVEFKEFATCLDDAGIKFPGISQPSAELLELRFLRELSKPQQVTDFFKCRILCQVVDVDATVCEDALLAIDKTNARIGGYDPLKTLRGWRGGHVDLETLSVRTKASARHSEPPVVHI